MSETNGSEYVNQVDPAYYRMSYNMIRCGVCGICWSEHPTTEYCERYRPPAELIAAMPRSVTSVVSRNVDPKGV